MESLFSGLPSAGTGWGHTGGGVGGRCRKTGAYTADRTDDATAYCESYVVHSCAPEGLAQGLTQSNCSVNLDKLVLSVCNSSRNLHFLALPTNEI